MKVSHCGNFSVGLVLFWGLKKGDFLAPKRGSKNRSKRRPPKSQTKRKITISLHCVVCSHCSMRNFTSGAGEGFVD